MDGSIDAILFDCFGVVLADPLRDLLKQREHVDIKQVNEAAHLLDTGEISYDEYVGRLAQISGEKVRHMYTLFQSTAAPTIELVQLITQLRKHYRVGMLSDTNVNELGPLLLRHDISGLFDHIVVSSEVGYAKPHPKILTIALESMMAHPTRALFIDDSKRNIQSIGDRHEDYTL